MIGVSAQYNAPHYLQFVGWWMFDKGKTLISGSVDSVADQSGNGRIATAPDSAARFTEVGSYRNGYGAIYSPLTTDKIRERLVFTNITLSGDFTFYCVGKKDILARVLATLGWTGGSMNSRMPAIWTDGNSYIKTDAGTLLSVAFNSTDLFYMILRRTSGVFFCEINGTNFTYSSNSGTITLNTIGSFNDGGGTNTSIQKAYLCEIAISNVAHSNIDVGNMKDYLRNKWQV